MRFHYFMKWPHSMRGLTGNRASFADSPLCRGSHVICFGSSQFNEIGRKNRSAEKNINVRNLPNVSLALNASKATATSLHMLLGVNSKILIHEAVLGHPVLVPSYFKRSFSDKSAETHLARKQQKTPKPSVKEFNFTGKITDHDLNVKFNKVKVLLEKGKVVQVFLTASSRASKPDAMPVTKFQQKLIDYMGPLGKLHKDFSNEAVTRFTLTPTITKETEKSDVHQNDDDKTQLQ